MPLSRGLKRMLNADFTWYRKTGEDGFGNTEFAAGVALKCYIDAENAEYGQEQEGDTKTETEQESVPIITDAEGIEVEDDVEFEGRRRRVSQVTTYRDKRGVELCQIVQTITR